MTVAKDEAGVVGAARCACDCGMRLPFRNARGSVIGLADTPTRGLVATCLVLGRSLPALNDHHMSLPAPLLRRDRLPNVLFVWTDIKNAASNWLHGKLVHHRQNRPNLAASLFGAVVIGTGGLKRVHMLPIRCTHGKPRDGCPGRSR